MATEKLVLELNAKVDKAIKDLDDVKDTLRDTEDEGSKLSNTFATMGNAAIGMAKAATAAAAAITAIAVATAKADRTMGNLAVTAKMSKEEFKGLAFAFSQFDVDAKGAADALNDVSERIGEFVATFNQDGKGSGAFQDFADVMGLSDSAAAAFAMTLQEMSPEDAIVRMVDAMEDANVHGSEMSFVLKSMSNDLEYTSQLFRDNGAELEMLESAYLSMSEGLQLTTQQSEDLSELAGSFDLLTEGLGDASAMISSSIAPTLTTFFNSVIEIVPQATNTIIDFINQFRDVSELSSLREIEAQLEIAQDEYDRLAERIAEGTRGQLPAIQEKAEWERRINELLQQRTEILAEQAAAELEHIEAREGGIIGGEEEEFEKRLANHKEFTDKRIALDKKSVKTSERLLRAETSQKETALNAGLSAAKSVNSALLNDNKLVGAGIIVADTAQGIMKAFAQQGAYAFPTAAAIALTGVAQLANLNSADRGGGSIGTSATTPALSPIDIPNGDADDGANLVATDASGASGGAQNITLEIDGETIASIVYDNIGKLEQDGVIS